MARRKKEVSSAAGKPTDVAHVMVRVRAEDGLTLSAHRAVIGKHGRVLFAKIGKGASESLVSLLASQASTGVPTFLFLAMFSGFKEPFAIYQCNLIGVRDGPHSCIEDEMLVPVYLKAQVPKVGTWFEISSIERIAPDEIQRILIFTSGREASSSLRGMTSLFKVRVIGSNPMKKMTDKEAPVKKKVKSVDDSDLDGDLYDGEYYDDIKDWSST